MNSTPVKDIFGILCVFFFLVIPLSWICPEFVGDITGNTAFDVGIWVLILSIAFMKLDAEVEARREFIPDKNLVDFFSNGT